MKYFGNQEGRQPYHIILLWSEVCGTRGQLSAGLAHASTTTTTSHFGFRKIFEFLRNISEAANLSERDNRIFILIIIIY